MRSSFLFRRAASLLSLSSLSAQQLEVHVKTAFACEGCTALATAFPTKVFAPNSSVYEYENHNFWSETEYLSPSCVFRPESAEDIAAAIPLLSIADTKFAVRGGGHMGIKVGPPFPASPVMFHVLTISGCK